MAVPTTILTAEESRVVRDSDPVLSDRPPGVDLPGKLNAFAESVSSEVAAVSDTANATNAGLVSGIETVLNGQSSVTVTAPLGVGNGGGVPVFACLNEADGTIVVRSAAWSTDDIVITLSGAVSADRDVAWFVDAR